MITVDTLRADHLTSYGYARETSPSIDRLAARGVLFERAIAQWPKTGTSFASIFTGRYPQTTGITHKAAVRIPADYLTLPQLFEREGFDTVAVVSNGVLSDELGWDSGFDRYLETWSDDDSDVPEEYRRSIYAGRVNELALPLFEEHRNAERLFAWIHYSDPHAPYVLPEDFENPFLGDRWDQRDEQVDLRGTTGRAIGDHTELGFYVAQYDANIRVLDHYFQQLVDHLAALGLLEDSLLVFTADHGESLGEHGSFFEHGPLPYNTTSHVPLFFVEDGVLRSEVRVAEAVELVDLYPTLLGHVFPHLATDPIFDGLEGESLAPFLLQWPSETPPRLAFSEAGRTPRHFRSVQDRSWKLVYRPPPDPSREGPENWELYDLAHDPGELLDISQQELEQVARLRRAMLGWIRDSPERAGSGADSEELGEETRRALRALGYVE